jgi:hypothetical protein
VPFREDIVVLRIPEAEIVAEPRETMVKQLGAA